MSKHEGINQNDFVIEQRVEEILSTLPKEKIVDVNKEKLIQQITDAFYTYESPQGHYVFDRDMPNVIYSLGFVPTLHELNQLIFAMRYHPHSRRIEREEIDADHHLIYFADYVDIILPKYLKKEYQSATDIELLKCLQKLDQTKRNYLHKKIFIQTLSSMEDVLDPNESDELMNFLMKHPNLTIDYLPDFFNYQKYVKHLLPVRHRIYLDLTKQE